MSEKIDRNFNLKGELMVKIKLLSSNDVAIFVNICNNYDCDINCKMGSFLFDAKSLVAMIQTICNEIEIELITDNNDLKDVFYEEIKLWIV